MGNIFQLDKFVKNFRADKKREDAFPLSAVHICIADKKREGEFPLSAVHICIPQAARSGLV